MVSVSVGRLAAGCLIEEAQFCGADRRENEVTEPGSSGGHSQSCSAAAAAAGSGGGERRRRGAAGRGGGRGRGAAGRPSRRSAGDAQRGGGAAAAPRGGSRAAAPAPSEARRRISSKIKASPKSNRIAVTDFHGTVKRALQKRMAQQLPIKLQKRSALIFTLEFSVQREQYTATSFEMIRRLSQHTGNQSKHEFPFFFFFKTCSGHCLKWDSVQSPKRKGKKNPESPV
ncbi:uncharacterized protein LOC143694391 [Agelaius phoeniceus]|uniref:uncharacterized protein LOC143694391 n=1 Tax=Agelaius phoeniceus TaxID=39638 RepID=UPI0040552A51